MAAKINNESNRNMVMAMKAYGNVIMKAISKIIIMAINNEYIEIMQQ